MLRCVVVDSSRVPVPEESSIARCTIDMVNDKYSPKIERVDYTFSLVLTVNLNQRKIELGETPGSVGKRKTAKLSSVSDSVLISYRSYLLLLY